MSRFKGSFIVLVALCSIAASADVPCGGEDAIVAFEALEKLQVEDPKLELDGAFEDLKILIEGDCDSVEAELAEADLESFASDLLDDSGQAASGCGTQARKDRDECRAACKNSPRLFCGCGVAFVLDAISCIRGRS
jgi:hypothetical protein